jgi:uncharacterized protein with HEPN domain
MYDKELALEILNQILQSTTIISKRYSKITSNDFVNTENTEKGHEILDAICMQLIIIGESLKNLDKVTNNLLLNKYPEINWKKVKGMRDIISHHYFDINVKVVYEVCKNEIPQLHTVISKMIAVETQ